MAAALGGAPAVAAADGVQLDEPGPSARTEPYAHTLAAVVRDESQQYDRAVTLYRLGFLHSAYAMFSDIADRPSHARRHAALPWLVALSQILPEPADVASRLAAYDDRELAAFAAERPELAARISYLVAQHAYRTRQYERAVRQLASIDARSAAYAPAQLWLGITRVREGRSVPAVEAFRRVVQLGSQDRAKRPLADLARLSIARTLYSASLRLDENNSPVVEAPALSAAVAQYRLIEPESDVWLEAQHELAWAYFMAGDRQRALGALFSLDTPWFPDAYFPEAEVLGIAIYAAACDYDAAASEVARFEARHAPTLRGLQALLASHRDDAALVAYLAAARDAPSSLAPEVARPIRRALRDRSLVRALAYLGQLDGEIARLGRAALPVEVSERLRIVRAVALANAGGQARALLQQSIDELAEYLRVRVPILVPSLDADGRSEVVSEERRVRAESDAEIAWPFDGEYWRDELGTYRVSLPSRCGRDFGASRMSRATGRLR